MSKPLNQYLRVPFRGTHYVEAAALDSAIVQIANLEKKLGTHPDTHGGPLEVPEESILKTEEDQITPEQLAAVAEQDKAFEDLIHKAGGSLLDGETGPSQVLAYVNSVEAERNTAVSALTSEQGLHSTTKEQLAGVQKDLRELAFSAEKALRRTHFTSRSSDNLRQKVLVAAQSNATSAVPIDCGHGASLLPEAKSENASAPHAADAPAS